METNGRPVAGTASPLSPKARLVWAAEAAFLGLVVGGVGVALAVLTERPLLGLLGLVPVAIGAWWGQLTWRRWTWSVSDLALELHHGVVVRRASFVPLHRIQQIDVHRGPIDRALGLAELVVRTAAATTDATLPGLDLEEARRLRGHLLARAGVDDAV